MSRYFASSFRCSFYFRRRERNFANIIASVLRRGLRRANAGNPNNDPDTKIDSNTCRISNLIGNLFINHFIREKTNKFQLQRLLRRAHRCKSISIFRFKSLFILLAVDALSLRL